MAERQHGVVTRDQLRNVDFSDDEIDYRIAVGRLHPVYRGVFAVGHRKLTRSGRLMAAVLACGDGAVLDRYTAAEHHGVITVVASRPIEVVVNRADAPDRPPIVTRTSVLADDEMVVRGGIPVLSLARTVLAVAPLLDEEPLERVLEKAKRRGLTVAAMTRMVDSHFRRPGTPLLRKLLAAGIGDGITRSDAEDLCLGFVKRFDLPRPRVNVVIRVDDHEYEVDCLFPKKVILEIDSWEWHGNRPARRRDNKRDRVLTLAGFRVFRAFPEELDAELAREIHALLGA
jgi:hypothetical protein